MKKNVLALCMILILGISFLSAQDIESEFNFVGSELNPFGKYNPEAPDQVKDFEPMVGVCDCQSIRRNPDGTWQDTLSMVWKFKYIMNGFVL